MEIAVCSVLSIGEYLAVSNELNLGEVWKELLIALGICILNSFLVPFVKWLFTKIKDKIKKHQKTPENDGELADILLNGVDKLQETVESKLNELSNKGDKNGKDNNGTE